MFINVSELYESWTLKFCSATAPVHQSEGNNVWYSLSRKGQKQKLTAALCSTTGNFWISPCSNLISTHSASSNALGQIRVWWTKVCTHPFQRGEVLVGRQHRTPARNVPAAHTSFTPAATTLQPSWIGYRAFRMIIQILNNLTIASNMNSKAKYPSKCRNPPPQIPN